MANENIQLTEQLIETCKISKARWVTWIHRSPSGWHFGARHGLNKTRQAVLERFIRQLPTATWLAGTFSSGRMRSRQTGQTADSLGCRRLYVFPNVQAHSALLVGADQLEKQSESFFKILAMNAPTGLLRSAANEAQVDLVEEAESGSKPFEAALEVSYNPVGVLENVLEYLAGSIACDAALLSIRSGDIFRVESVWNCPPGVRGVDISINDNELLSEMAANRQSIIVNARQRSEAGITRRSVFGFGVELDAQAAIWMGVPVVIGQRVIGHLAFISQRPGSFTPGDLNRVTAQMSRLAYVVENAIVFAEAARYLQQFALLNDLASVASIGVDTHEVARRVMQRLSRTFRTQPAGVFLLSPDGKMLREYGVDVKDSTPMVIPVEGSMIGRVVETGFSIRIGDLSNYPERGNNFEDRPDMQSELAVPLKYRGKVIGALALGSSAANAFSHQDEQLLVVIGSHLAGLFENMRLNEETRQRAHNLNLIHQVVRKVVGLNDLDQIAQVAADLMVKRFSYELAAVILLDENSKLPSVKIVGESDPSHRFNEAEKTGLVGVSVQVLRDGQSRLINDTTLESELQSGNGLPGGSEMCVPLREGERILGVIDVQRSRRHAFSENDLVTLEALAGVLSSVVLSARRYRQLQDSVRQLQAVRETAIDIAGDLDLDALLKRVVHRARELVGAEGAELGLIDEKQQVVRVLVSDTPWYDSNDQEIALESGVAGRVAALGEPLVVPDYNSWAGRLFPDKEAPFKSVAGVPLKFQGQVIGTLTVIDNRPDWSFTPEHVQLLELLAPQVTVWIRNARLYQELQERIEAQHAAENRLIRSARLAAVGEMAAGVAHELNNPLTTVAGFVELVLEELPPDSPHRADLELVLRESQRARTVVRRLLDFSRPVENRRIRSDINELVKDVLSLVNHLLRTGGVETVSEYGVDLPWVPVDPGQIKQVLLNLVHNAIQAMPGGGSLRIKTGLVTNGVGVDKHVWVTVSVADTGEGINSLNMERIFEPFFTTRPAGKGTGLGLSVSYGIVTDHGGYIEVESQVGVGSCFTVFLPLEGDEKYG